MVALTNLGASVGCSIGGPLFFLFFVLGVTLAIFLDQKIRRRRRTSYLFIFTLVAISFHRHSTGVEWVG